MSAACFCDKRTVAEIESPQGTKARVSSVDCGATTDFAMNVEVSGFIGSTLVLGTRGTEAPSIQFIDGGKTLPITVPKSIPDRSIYPYTDQTHGVNVVIRREP